MRFLIVDTDYPAFLQWLYSKHKGLQHRSFDEQLQVRAASLFGQTDFLSENLRILGHEAHSIHANNAFIQAAWAREHGETDRDWEFRLRRGFVPWISRRTTQRRLDRILAAQVRHYKPDVLVNGSIHWSREVFREIRPYVRLLVGLHAAPLPVVWDPDVYDLMLSCGDNFVERFRSLGLRSERLRLAFEPSVLERLSETAPTIPVSFVGNVSASHASRVRWLEHVCGRVSVQVWIPSTQGLPEKSAITRRRHEAAWGLEMYEVLHRSSITLNHHIDVAEAYAGNLRLFEATGVGTLLVTDWKKNLHEMFEPGKEIIAYRTPEECVELVRYYLNHEEERRAVAAAGQRRTLRDHTYHQRMQELVGLVQKHL